jgi:hypothetical protein
LYSKHTTQSGQPAQLGRPLFPFYRTALKEEKERKKNNVFPLKLITF